MKHLRYNLMGAPKGHPQQIMKDLKISYKHSTPQSMGDQWWFWNCGNVPDPLPEYLEDLDVDPLEMIGYGLGREEAVKISNGG